MRQIASGLNVRAVEVMDIDGDGDLDVLTAAWDQDAFLWFENLVGDASTWVQQTVRADVDSPSAAALADFDGDGDLDLAAGAELDGEDSVAIWQNMLLSELGCGGGYNAGDRIELVAAPSPGSGVAQWAGTDDDASTSTVNRATMPSAAHTVSVDYLAGCFVLSLGHTGLGLDPIAAPQNSPGCPAGSYVVGEPIDLTATPEPLPGWRVDGWSGTDDDASKASTNRVTMPAANHVVEAHYLFDGHLLHSHVAAYGLRRRSGRGPRQLVKLPGGDVPTFAADHPDRSPGSGAGR